MTSRSIKIAIVVGIALAVAGCGKSGQKNGAIASSADEAAAFAAPQFTDWLTLRITPDAADQVQNITALNGVDNRPTYGAAYMSHQFPGCSGAPQEPYTMSFVASITGFQLDPDTILGWLKKQGMLDVVSYTISYPNTQFPNYGTVNTFVCPVLTDRLRIQLPVNQRMLDIHHGITIPFARRVFDSWSYENRYDMPVPGKGNVKVFAGTMAYHMETNFPGITFVGTGNAAVKIYLDPDNGRWTVASFETHDPSFSLVTQ